MRTLEKRTLIDRRALLKRGTAAVMVSAMAGGLDARAAFAATLKTVQTADGAATLVRMARDIYPHDRVADSYYEAAVARIDGDLAAANAHSLLRDGVAMLDTSAIKASGKRYLATEGEEDRVAILKSIETSPFFQTMRGGMVTALYNQPDLWVKLGYEGPSAEYGGYLHRGFNDIDWLPL